MRLLTIENVDKKRWVDGWVVEYNSHISTASALSNEGYHFHLVNPNKKESDIGVTISRMPAPLTTKVEVCYNVSISYNTWGNVIHKEDVSLSTIKNGDTFWKAVTDWLKNNPK